MRIKRLNNRQRLGVFLLVISTISWCFVPVLPFLPLETSTKVGAGVALVVFGEVTGYPGMALLGKETVQALANGWQRVKRYLRGLFIKPE